MEEDCTNEVDMLDFLGMMGVFKGHFWTIGECFVRGLLCFCIVNVWETGEVMSMAMWELGTLYKGVRGVVVCYCLSSVTRVAWRRGGESLRDAHFLFSSIRVGKILVG